MGKPTYNLHSHTFRCGHAFGQDYEYVEAAIKAGYKQLGFSDHVMLPGVTQEGIRGNYHQLGEYLSSVGFLKEQYADQIDIRIGFEAEWYGDRFADYYRYLLSRPDVEYMILGQHCFLGAENRMFWYTTLERPYRIDRYCDALIEGMESGLFTYVAHPDIYIRWNGAFDKRCEEIAHLIAKTAEKMHLPLELNCAPSRANPAYVFSEDTLSYPCPQFWDIVSQYKVDVVIGVDAHNPSDYELTYYDYFLAFAKKHHLHLLKESPLKK